MCSISIVQGTNDSIRKTHDVPFTAIAGVLTPEIRARRVGGCGVGAAFACGEGAASESTTISILMGRPRVRKQAR